MSSNNKEPEVFNLLNLYQDDDDEDDDIEEAQKNESLGGDDMPDENFDPQPSEVQGEKQQQQIENNGEAVSKTPNLRPPTPLQGPSSTVEFDVSRRRRENPSIVDYAHDDVAMSPEHAEGEFVVKNSGRVTSGEEVEGSHDLEQRTPTDDVRIITPNSQVDSSQLSSQVDVPQPDHNTMEESEDVVGKNVSVSKDNGIDTDPVQKFLPPPPEEKCSDELQEKINKFLAYKRQGKSFNVEVRNRKDYRNPDFLRHAVRYQDIDEIGSCFSKDVFDPHGYDESDYFDAIEIDMKREMERKEQERKRSQKVDFVSGGTQAGIGGTAPKVALPSPGVSNLPASGLQSGSADPLTREVRQNKKSKWDKVDGDRRNVLGGVQDTLSSVGSHAALLSAANVGSGYAVFAQQRRREAEEKRSSDRKVERRS